MQILNAKYINILKEKIYRTKMHEKKVSFFIASQKQCNREQ